MTPPPEPPRTMPMRLRLTLLAALAVVSAVAGASVRTHAGARRRVVVVLPAAPGLREGGPVTYLGVAAGTVERIDLSTGRVVVTLGITRRDVVLRAGDAVHLRTLGLLGDAVVDVTPGPRAAPALGANDTLVFVPAAPPVVPVIPRADATTPAGH